ncbi:MAG: HAD-IB family phosphatase [Thermoplasmatales archaeon]|nr:MAG: HAD-IB family phosphatase [Thermoplasmatales archaeon]
MTSVCRFYCYRKNRTTVSYNIGKAKKVALVFFDMDGVLTDTISSWKHIHDYFGTSNERSVDEYLKGNINDLEFIKRDVSLWKKDGRFTHKNTIRDVLYDISLMKGARKCISYLRKHDIKTVILSAGLDILAERVAKETRIDYVLANGIKNDENGRLTGEGILRVQLMYKDRAVRNIAKRLDIPLEKCAAVGNSCFDIPMFETCGIGIAFNPDDDCVRKSADIILEGRDLNRLIPVLEQFV